MKIFGIRLKIEREKNKENDPKWTQEYVARLLGVARSTYTAYENGTKQPPLETLNKIADIFGVDVDYLLGRNSDRQKKISRGTKEFLDAVELSDSSAIDKLKSLLTHNGNKISDEAIKEILSYARYKISRDSD